MNIIQLVFLLLFVCCSFKCVAEANGIGNNTNNIMCVEEDRQALFKFKHAIKIDRCGLLSTWAGDNQNCCQWDGVSCDNNTGRVIKLSLKGFEDFRTGYNTYCLEGRVSSSVVDLKHLTYLDLSFNNFSYQPVPTFIGSLVNLKYLNLSDSRFEGEIPHQLGNLSSLISLDLTSYYGYLYVNDLSWLSRLTRLTSLNLSYVDLSRATNWSQIVNNLPFLRILRLDGCELSSPVIPRPLSFKNSSTTLHFISLRWNHWNDSSLIYAWLFNLSGINTHLAHLDLSDNQLGGPLPSAFGNLHSLTHLDLSENQLGGPLPSAFGNLHSLTHLDLSWNQLEGPLPSAFGNLHSLSYLDLSENQLGGPLPSDFGNLHSLSYLDLSGNQFQGNIPPSFFGNMHSLTYLNLEDNQLEGPIPDTISNIKPLTHLHLSFNNFQSLPKTLGNLCSLQKLWLYNNSLSDELPNIIQTLIGCADKSLLHLDLSFNQIWGSIPDSIGVFFSLRELSLSQNKLNGSISESLGQLSMLETLDLYSNNLKGSLFSIHFSNLSKLRELYLGNNSALTLNNVSVDWVPPFQLDVIDLSNCRLGPLFPKWIMTQTNYSFLDLSNAGISDTIPKSFWKTSLSSSKLSYLNLSYNMINGTLPDFTKLQLTPLLDNGAEIDLSFNKLEGVLPSIPENVSSFLVNNNRFSNAIPLLCPKSAKKSLLEVDLSNNLLTGRLPDCWMNFPLLQVLHLENNSFSGVIPSSIAYLRQLQVLHLHNNAIFGKMPSSLENLTSLVFLDLGYNSLSEHISPSIWVKLGRLSILSLRSNNFVGEIPSTLCQMSSLQILDLSVNHITGIIPECIRNFTSMQNSTDLLPQLFKNSSINSYTFYSDSIAIMWKRKEWSLKNSLGLVKAIDLSQNKLQGQIPSEISILQGLSLLNLSNNNLSGSITPKVGQLTALQALDFSNNKLSGEIPTSLAELNFLGILDLSNNNLSGEIPNIPQLQRFDDKSYTGNPKLCGMPLPNCPWDQPPHDNEPTNEVNANHQDDSNATFFIGLYISVVLGFIVGFWGVCGSLVLKRTWRQAFFRFFEDMGDQFHAKVYLKMARLWRRQ